MTLHKILPCRSASCFQKIQRNANPSFNIFTSLSRHLSQSQIQHSSIKLSCNSLLSQQSSKPVFTFINNGACRHYGAGYPHPTRAQALERIIQILSQHENTVGEPKENSTLEELGLSLLDRVEIIHELEEQFGCRITDDDGFIADSVNDLTNIIVDHPHSKWYRI